MKSFSSDEGYQAPGSPCLVDQEIYMPNYVVLIPLVRAVPHCEPTGCPRWTQEISFC